MFTSSIVCFIILAFIARRDVSATDCASDNIDVIRCMEHWSDIDQSELVRAYTEQQLATICGKIVESEKCLKGIRCEDDPRFIYKHQWQAIKEGYGGYLCGDAKTVYLRNHACWVSATVKALVKNCTDELSANSRQQTTEANCRTMKTFVSCMKHSTSSCPAEATNFFHHFVVLSIRPPYTAAGCKIEISSASRSFRSSLALVSSGLLAVMVVL